MLVLRQSQNAALGGRVPQPSNLFLDTREGEYVFKLASELRCF